MTEEQRDQVLALLYEDLDLTKNLLHTIKEQVKDQNISNYPIFVASDLPVAVGSLIVNKREINTHWYFAASHLEEFVLKGLVAKDKINSFRELYKKHSKELCVFVINDEAGDFVFIDPHNNPGDFQD